MASLLMHVTVADEVRKGIKDLDTLYNVISKYRWAYNLGAMLPDLPLFEKFWNKVLLYILNKPYPESEWANVTHLKPPWLLAKALLRYRNEGKFQAITLGYITHVYLDVYVHEFISNITNEYLKPSINRSMLHDFIENYQSLFWYKKYKGYNDFGRKELIKFMEFTPGKGFNLPADIFTMILTSLGEAFGEVPRIAQLKSWCRGTYEYILLISSFLGNLSNRKTERIANNIEWIEKLQDLSSYEEAISKIKEIFEKIETEKLFQKEVDSEEKLDSIWKQFFPFKNLHSIALLQKEEVDR